MASCDSGSVENWLEATNTQKGILHLINNSCREKITCDHCKGLAFLPYATVCGHLFCTNCLRVIMARRQRCLIDDRILHLKEITLSERLKDKILQLPMRCPYHEYGCTATIHVGDCWEHVFLCAQVFSPIPCPWECGKIIKRQSMKHHFLNECHRSPPASVSLALTSSSSKEGPAPVFGRKVVYPLKAVSLSSPTKDENAAKYQNPTNRRLECRFSWQVTDYYKRKYLESIGSVYFVDSELFSHHSLGHHFKIRLYLNGIGVGKGTHTSVFIVVQRDCEKQSSSSPEEFQAHKLKITLLNQNTAELKLNVNKCLDYDPNKSRFKPSGDNTVEQYGFRKFCEQSKTEHPDYLKNDTLKFEVIIDLIKK